MAKLAKKGEMGDYRKRKIFFEGKAKKKQIDVEDILIFGNLAEASDVSFLRKISYENFFPKDIKQNSVPLGIWCDVVCIFLEKGYDGLREACEADPGLIPFCLGFLEYKKTRNAVKLLNYFGKNFQGEIQLKIASTLNLICSFKDAPSLTIEDEEDCRSWLHPMLKRSLPPGQLASVVCALRGVGNLESIKILKEIPSFQSPYLNLEKDVVRIIKKR